MLHLSILLAAVPSDPDWVAPFLRGARALESGAAREALIDLAASDLILPEHPQTDWLTAGAHARLGEYDAAFARLTRCVENGGGETALLAWDPDLASLREDPRFAALQVVLEEGSVATEQRFEGAFATGVTGTIDALGPRASSIAIVRGSHAVLVDGRSGEVVTVLERPGERSSAAAISPDGRWVVVCGQRDDSSRQYARVHDARSGSLVHELGPVGWQAGLTFSADGRRLLARGLSPRDTPVIFKTADWSLEYVVPTDADQTALSPLGDRLLLLARDGDVASNVFLWDIDERRIVGRLDGVSAISNTSMGFSTDGALAFVVENMRGSVRILDGRTGSQVARIEPVVQSAVDDAQRGDPKLQRISSAVFLGASGEIATIDMLRKVRIWNARSAELVRDFQVGDIGKWIHLLAAENGDVILASGGPGPIHALDARTGAPLWSDVHGNIPVLSPDGERVAYSSWRRPHTVRESRSGRIVVQCEPLAFPSTEVVAAPDASALWVGGCDGSVRRVDARTGRTIHRTKIGSDPIAQLTLSGDGARLAVRDARGVTHVVRADTLAVGAVVRCAESSEFFYDALGPQFSPAGDALLVSCPVEGLRIFDVGDGKLRCRLQVDNPRWSRAFAPDGSFVAVGDEGRVHFLDARSGAARRAPLTIQGHVYTLAFEPDGSRLWVGNDKSTVAVFEVASGNLVHSIDVQDLDPLDTVEVGSIEFRADGRLAVIGSSGWAVVAGYEVESFSRIWNFEYDGGNGSPMRSAFDASGERVLVWGQMRRTPRIVAAEDGRTLVDLQGRYMELLGLDDAELVGAHTGSELDVLRARDGRVSWTRIDAPNDGWVLASPSRHIDGSREALERVHVVLEDGSLPLDALAAALLDPKRVRAAAEGVDLAPARRLDVPTITQLEPDERSPESVDGKRTRTVRYESSSSDGVHGFEVVVDGRERFEPGEARDASRRRLSLAVEADDEARTPVRVRAISTRGVMSRALRFE